MKRLITSIIFTLVIIALYQFVDINLFAIDFPRRVNSELFKSLRTDPEVDTEVIIFDTENMSADDLAKKLKILESLGPKAIGVSLCNSRDTSGTLDHYLSKSNTIVVCDCRSNTDKGTSRITTDANTVTHFRTDKDSYFELQLSQRSNEFKGRKNKKERINYRPADKYLQVSLNEIENMSDYLVKDKTVLVGRLSDSLVTPLNSAYETLDTVKGDMSEVLVSANIISTISRNEFINEVSPILRVSIILLMSLTCIGLIKVVWTRYSAINILLGLMILMILVGLSSYIIVFAFSKSYYVELNEMTLVLIISSIVAFYWDAKDRKRTSRSTIPGLGQGVRESSQ